MDYKEVYNEIEGLSRAHLSGGLGKHVDHESAIKKFIRLCSAEAWGGGEGGRVVRTFWRNIEKFRPFSLDGRVASVLLKRNEMDYPHLIFDVESESVVRIC